ncbi:solute carrier family 22 member 7-like [Dermacentor variabilis]|uniref:solute carrier family 22 member 7-like n=1 Tax=Dermacentor variabilis TaxID=34621 RepID=UPI003F5C784B
MQEVGMSHRSERAKPVMGRMRRSGSLASLMLPYRFRPSTDRGSLSATDTQMQNMVVFGFGRFQRLVLLCAQITTFVAYSQSIAVVNDLEPVDHWCRQGSEYANVSADAWKELHLPRRPDGRGYDKCHRYATPLAAPVSAATEDPAEVNLTRLVVACDAWDYDTGSTGFTVLVYWDIVCDRAWYRYLYQVAFMCGGALSVPCAGLASNRWGRRPVMWVSVCALLCASSATCLAPTLIAFVALRFIASAAVSVLEVVSFVLLFESTPTGPREPFCALAICWPTVLAPVFVVTVAYMAFNWRVSHAGLTFPALFLLWTVYVTEESPHWLIVSHRFHEARRVALWAARLNDEDPDIVIERLEKVKETLASSPTAGSLGEADGVAAANAVREAEHAAGMRKTARRTHLSYFRSRAMLAHCFVVFGCWFMVSVNYYYRSLDMPHLNFIKWVVVACNVPAMTIAYFIIRHHGRLTPLVVLLVAVSVMLLFNTVARFLGLNFPSQLVLMWRLLLLNIAYVLLCIHTVSLFPTQVRSVAFACAYTFGRLGAMTAEAFQVAESVLRYDMGALPIGVAALNLLVFSLLLLTLSDKTLLDIVTRVDVINAAGAPPPPVKKRRISPDSLSPKQ